MTTWWLCWLRRFALVANRRAGCFNMLWPDLCSHFCSEYTIGGGEGDGGQEEIGDSVSLIGSSLTTINGDSVSRDILRVACSAIGGKHSSSISSILSGEFGGESTSELDVVRLQYECSALMGMVPSAASVIRRSCNMTGGLTSSSPVVGFQSSSAATLNTSVIGPRSESHSSFKSLAPIS